MSALTSFAFSDSLSVRVQNFNGTSWFVAKDIVSCLDYTTSVLSNVSALFKSVPDKWKQIKPFETKGGIQNLLAVTEQGLYRFLMRSDKPKAVPFQDWLADKVLPAIRKQGAYISDKLTYEEALKIVEERHASETQTITNEQQYELSSRVMRKTHALFGNKNYSFVYRALKRRFRIPRYTCLLQRDFETALAFVDGLKVSDFNVPDVKEREVPLQNYVVQYPSFTISSSGSVPLPAIPAIPVNKHYITDNELQAIKSLIYYFDDLFKPQIQWAAKEAYRQGRSDASRFYDVWHEPLWFIGRMRTLISRNS